MLLLGKPTPRLLTAVTRKDKFAHGDRLVSLTRRAEESLTVVSGKNFPGSNSELNSTRKLFTIEEPIIQLNSVLKSEQFEERLKLKG